AVVLDRPRHDELVREIRQAGARIKLIPDGDVAGAVNTAFDETGVDILLGIGGAPEGGLAAVALKCLGGDIKGKWIPSNDDERERCREMGSDDLEQVDYMEEVCSGDDAIFVATGVTDGEVLKGVQYKGSKATTQSVVRRAKRGTVRFIDGEHRLKTKPNLVMKP